MKLVLAAFALVLSASAIADRARLSFRPPVITAKRFAKPQIRAGQRFFSPVTSSPVAPNSRP